MSIRLVVDDLVLHRYAHLDAGVGELFGVINDDGAQVGIPVLALSRAVSRSREDPDALGNLRRLVASPGVRVLPVADAFPLAELTGRLREFDPFLGQLAQEALRHDACVYTAWGDQLRYRFDMLEILDLDS